MKTKLLATVSVAALVLSAGAARADGDFSGVAQFSLGGGTSDDTLDLSDDPFTYAGKAKGIWTLAPDFQFQVDLFAEENKDLTSGLDENDASVFGGTVHLIHVFGDRARFGLAGSIWNTDLVSDVPQPDATYGLAALETQFFGAEWTGIIQAGVFTEIDCSSGGGDCSPALESGSYLRGKARWFLNDNTALSLEGLRMWGSLDDDLFSGKSLNAAHDFWALEAEHRFGDCWSGFVNLSHESTSVSVADIDTRMASIGVRFYLDQPTIRANDRKGAEFDTPNFGMAAARLSDPDFLD